MATAKHRGVPGLLGVLALGLLLAAGGAVTAYQEVNPFAAGGTSAPGRFAALAGDEYRPAPSLLSKRLLLDACVEAISGAYGRLQAGEDRRRVLESCRRHADQITAEAPSYSYGWYVGARAAAELGDKAGLNMRLRNAQITGPTEQWVAELRVALAEDHYAAVTPEVRSRHDADLRLLVTSRRGIDTIAARYVADPDFRARITAVVEAMPEDDQARFVGRVGAAASREAAR